VGHNTKEASYVETALVYMREHPRMVIPVIFMLAFGENLAIASLLLPATAILMAASLVLAASRANPWSLSFWAGTGAALGFTASYWLGVLFHEPIMQMSLMKSHASAVESVYAFFDKWGVLGVFFSHFSGPLRAFVSLVAGMIEMNHLQFQAANIGGAYLWGVMMMLPLFLVRYVPQSVQDWFWRYRIGLLTAVVLASMVIAAIYLDRAPYTSKT
jgi:membrane protein DedA with SNARE-associated domain